MQDDNTTADTSASPAQDDASPSPAEVLQQELRTLSRLGRKYLWAEPDIHQKLQSTGISIEPARFYSQRPTVEDIRGSFEYDDAGQEIPVYDDGSVFDLETIKAYMKDVAALGAGLEAPMDGNRDDPEGFYWNNPAFSYSDAMSYWCAIRHFKPDNVLEIGSGFSSLLAGQALAENGAGKLTCIEPYPREWLQKRLPEMTLIDQPIQAISPEQINDQLSDGDILFIDSTHTVKIGSDCLWIYLKLLPAIQRDIIVHVHDISLPYGLNQKKALEKHIHWVESYLLMAYLIDNPRCEVFFGSAIARRQLLTEARAFMHDRFPPGGGSLWFRQRPRG